MLRKDFARLMVSYSTILNIIVDCKTHSCYVFLLNCTTVVQASGLSINDDPENNHSLARLVDPLMPDAKNNLKNGYSMDIMQQSTRLVVNPITL